MSYPAQTSYYPAVSDSVAPYPSSFAPGSQSHLAAYPPQAESHTSHYGAFPNHKPKESQSPRTAGPTLPSFAGKGPSSSGSLPCSPRTTNYGEMPSRVNDGAEQNNDAPSTGAYGTMPSPLSLQPAHSNQQPSSGPSTSNYGSMPPPSSFPAKNSASEPAHFGSMPPPRASSAAIDEPTGPIKMGPRQGDALFGRASGSLAKLQFAPEEPVSLGARETANYGRIPNFSPETHTYGEFPTEETVRSQPSPRNSGSGAPVTANYCSLPDASQLASRGAQISPRGSSSKMVPSLTSLQPLLRSEGPSDAPPSATYTSLPPARALQSYGQSQSNAYTSLPSLPPPEFQSSGPGEYGSLPVVDPSTSQPNSSPRSPRFAEYPQALTETTTDAPKATYSHIPQPKVNLVHGPVPAPSKRAAAPRAQQPDLPRRANTFMVPSKSDEKPVKVAKLAKSSDKSLKPKEARDTKNAKETKGSKEQEENKRPKPSKVSSLSAQPALPSARSVPNLNAKSSKVPMKASGIFSPKRVQENK